MYQYQGGACGIIADKLHRTIVDDLEQLKNFLPILIFVGAYVLTDIYVATAALMIAVTVQVGLLWLTKKPISMELKVTFWVGLVMGSLTLIFRNELFIQWKTTIVYWVMASGLVATHFKGKNYGMEMLLKKAFAGQVTEVEDAKAVWRAINIGWIAVFASFGAINLFVAYYYSLDFWVSFKLVGGLLMTFTAMIGSVFFLYRKGLIAEPEEVSEAPLDPAPDAPGDAP